MLAGCLTTGVSIGSFSVVPTRLGLLEDAASCAMSSAKSTARFIPESRRTCFFQKWTDASVASRCRTCSFSLALSSSTCRFSISFSSFSTWTLASKAILALASSLDICVAEIDFCLSTRLFDIEVLRSPLSFDLISKFSSESSSTSFVAFFSSFSVSMCCSRRFLYRVSRLVILSYNSKTLILDFSSSPAISSTVFVSLSFASTRALFCFNKLS
mmetsp:Transcript_16765/g.26612  ORF Transcript_16765/g.26612 Transcript_16765/m.26612 type:complete len:214 (+) Transcript_16765:598-1239(+)